MNSIFLFLLVAFVPLFVGAVYYHPKTFAPLWMRESGVDESRLKTGNMAIIFGTTYLFSLMLSFFLQTLVIHQSHIMSMIMNEPGFGDATSQVMTDVKSFMDKYGDNFRTFPHGALHGFITSLFLVLPALGITALFERRSWKYIALHWGYWAITLVIMGGLVCAYAEL